MRTSCAFVLVILTLAACTVKQPMPMPPVGFTEAELNQYVQLRAPRGWNTFRFGKAITLEVINISDQPIIFDRNYGTRIFLQQGRTWVEIKDQMISLEADDIVLEPKDDLTRRGGISILPELDEKTRSAKLRIFVIGYTYKGAVRGERVGAFIDIVLSR